jgi:lipoprotein-anchoring transpeptidase ErfK/SrfK
MHSNPSNHTNHNTSRLASVLLALMLMSTLATLSACGGDSSAQQQAQQKQAQLDNALQNARTIGVSSTLLAPIIHQEQQLSSTSAPLTFFNDQPATDYYRNLATRYGQLQTQLQGLVQTTTDQSRTQAQRDLQNLQLDLTHGRTSGLPVQYFAQQFQSYQTELASAHDPKDFAAISSKAKVTMQSLDLLQTTSTQLTTLKQTITQMKNAHLDVTVLQMQYASDQQTLTDAKQPQDFQQIDTLIDAQYQQAVVNTTQALPYITVAKLNEFETKINTLKLYGGDISAYQKKLDADRTMMQRTTDVQSYMRFAQQVDTDIASMSTDLAQDEAHYLLQQFHQEVTSWGNAHLYHDSDDGQNYPLDGAYMQQGIGSDLDLDYSYAATADDYQAMSDEINNALFNLHMMEQDYNDHTPYNKVHATDLQMLAHYKLQHSQVIMVSLAGQSLRLYQNGKLVNAFLVTTGRVELPSVPGVWPVLDRQSPTVFKSAEPKSSPYWYPDTPIHYAILYHAGGYYVHDAWWRVDYGPGTQFPHVDSGGDASFANNGSHGCVNVQEQQAAWLYANTDWNTMIVIY